MAIFFDPIYAMPDCACHYILLISGFQNFVTRVTKNPATVTRKIVAATVNDSGRYVLYHNDHVIWAISMIASD